MSQSPRALAAPWALSAPALVLFACLLLVPLGLTAVLSFNAFDHATGVKNNVYTLAHYTAVLTDEYYYGIFWRTFWMGDTIEGGSKDERTPSFIASINKTIPAMWWGVNTMTTVGYGDLHPITPWGKFLGGIIAILGVAIFALPTGILASGFAELIRGQVEKRKIVCPHCGEEFHEHKH